jgi:hypothetical protein
MRAASMAIERFSFSLFCPVKSASLQVFGLWIPGNQFPVGHELPD